VQVPVRGCDVGGWTDTWFAGTGRVCSIALEPGVTVVAEGADAGVHVSLLDTGERFAADRAPAAHRLLAEAVAEAEVPPGVGLHLAISAAAPPGTSLGTSAAVSVGVIAAVDALVRGTIRPPGELAAAAHRVEGDRLGRQCGVQDQLAAAHGGANRIDVDFPSATVHPIPLEAAVVDALGQQLVHVAYGGPHDSSAVHEQVIAALEVEGAGSPRLAHLRTLAADAERALRAGDLDAYGAVLTGATEAQRLLHPALVSPEADDLIAVARAEGALGWKLNGAGGSGGSLSILCPDATAAVRVADGARRLGHLAMALRPAAGGARVTG